MSGPPFHLDPEGFIEKITPGVRQLVRDEVATLLRDQVPTLVGALLKDALSRQVEHLTIVEALDDAVKAAVKQRKEELRGD